MLKSLFQFCLCLIILSPLLALGMEGLSTKSESFNFLKIHVLPYYAINSLLLCLFTVFGACLIAIPTAWAITQYDFFCKKVIEVMLLLPIAFPAYIVAYAYTSLLGEITLAPIRSLGGASLILTLCLYPYVYIFARTAFLKQAQNQSQISAAKLLGATNKNLFFTIILPNARPYIMVGIALVMMETLADYGTVSYFNIKVFSTGIYNAWAGYGDSVAAAKISLIMLCFVFLILLLEKKNRASMAFYSSETEKKTKASLTTLSPLPSIMMFVFFALPVFFGFLLPTGLLLNLTINDFETRGVRESFAGLLPLLKNTATLAVGVSIPMVLLGYISAVIHRSSRNRIEEFFYLISGFGYAIPGVVLGLGLLFVSNWLQTLTPVLVSGSLFLLTLGYFIRFWTIPAQTIEAGFEKISPTIDDASRLMRYNRVMEFWYIRLPLLWPAMLSGFIILSVEIIKELPLTLMLRPFDYNTLAVNAYHLASDERLAQAALPSLIIALCGIIPVIFLSRLIRET